MASTSTGPRVHVPEHFNAAVFFVDANLERGSGDRPAFFFEDTEVSYAELAGNVNRAGSALRELGVEVENRVAVLLPDCPELAYAFFGAIKIGAVAVPLNTLLTADEYRRLLQDSRAKALVVSPDLFQTVQPFIDELPHLRHVLVTGMVEQPGMRGSIHRWRDLLDQADADLEPAETSRDDVAFWLYTSGTTGSPSAAIHLHHDMVFSQELYAKGILDLGPEDRSLSVAKLFFAYGLGNSLYCPLGVGGSSILHPGRATPEYMAALINRHRPTVFYGVPTWYAATLQALDSGLELDSSSLRLCVSAGEPLSAHLYQQWLERTGVRILDGLGTTEVLHIFLSNRPGDIRPGSTGKPVPGYEVKLVDDDGALTPPGEVGNLTVRGDSICSGYWNKHAVTKQAIEGEWIKTRDKYHVDEDGYFWYDGRTNDMLKVGGRWVSPAEVESAVIAHPAVLECAVVGVVDADQLEKPKAFVVLRDGNNGDDQLAAEIQSFARSRLAVYKYPREIEFMDELPKTATGKIQRFKLRST